MACQIQLYPGTNLSFVFIELHCSIYLAVSIFFLLAIVLSVLLRYTDSDIFKLFLTLYIL